MCSQHICNSRSSSSNNNNSSVIVLVIQLAIVKVVLLMVDVNMRVQLYVSISRYQVYRHVYTLHNMHYIYQYIEHRYLDTYFCPFITGRASCIVRPSIELGFLKVNV